MRSGTLMVQDETTRQTISNCNGLDILSLKLLDILIMDRINFGAIEFANHKHNNKITIDLIKIVE